METKQDETKGIGRSDLQGTTYPDPLFNKEREYTKPLTQEEPLKLILEETRRTKKLLQWQMYIMIILVVLPLLALVVMFPMVIHSVTGSFANSVSP